GVVSQLVLQRTQEIGIRLALGAQARDILKLVVGKGMVLALMGVAIGLIAAVSLTRLTESLLYDVSPTDPVTLLVHAILFMGVALVASFVPARRAMRVDPMAALRCDYLPLSILLFYHPGKDTSTEG